jgi:hypothetical protein
MNWLAQMDLWGQQIKSGHGNARGGGLLERQMHCNAGHGRLALVSQQKTLKWMEECHSWQLGRMNQQLVADIQPKDGPFIHWKTNAQPLPLNDQQGQFIRRHHRMTKNWPDMDGESGAAGFGPCIFSVFLMAIMLMNGMVENGEAAPALISTGQQQQEGDGTWNPIRIY